MTSFAVSLAALAAAALFAAAPAVSATSEPLTVAGLKANHLATPLGLDDLHPRLNWILHSPKRGETQTAYRILVSSSPSLLARDQGDAWDSGRVASGDVSASYAGRPLHAARRYYWKVRSWGKDGRPSAWSAPSWWEMGLLSPADWSARWIVRGAMAARTRAEITFPPRTARYLRLRVTRLGIPVRGDRPIALANGRSGPGHRVQLARLQILDRASGARGDLALGKPVTASETQDVPGMWGVDFLTARREVRMRAPMGYSSRAHPSADASSAPVWVEVDLGRNVRFDAIRLYPRSDADSVRFTAANFPVDFTVETRADGASGFETARRVHSQPPPTFFGELPPPIFARAFDLAKKVRGARLSICGLGRYEAHINGKPVTKNVLEPADSDYTRRVEYRTYDVTKLLHPGENAVGVMLGNGTYDVSPPGDRFAKWAGPERAPMLLAQLDVEYADGTRERIATDASWKVSDGPMRLTHHYGGEDYDATLEKDGWDRAGYDYAGWEAAAIASAPEGALAAASGPPIRIVGVQKPVAVTEPRPGVFVVDMGRNFAGWPEVSVSGHAGDVIRIRPAELLDADGMIDQLSETNLWGDIRWTYRLKGGGRETYRPKFHYVGFRYLEITGYPGRPGLDDVRGLVLRAANAHSGEFATSNRLINSIHRIIETSVESNMYSVLTDCPHREKLGWLEVPHLMFASIAYNYDVAAWYGKIMRDMRDAQYPDGLVPTTAPEYMDLPGDFRDDPNWGGASVLIPWYHYQTYGDIGVLRQNFETMRRYVDYLTSRAEGHILSYGLGDWLSPEPGTPVPMVATAGYYRQARVVSEAAEVLGHDAEARKYAALADAIRDAVNARFLDASTGRYGDGTQAANALALDAGLVPDAQRAAVLNSLVANIQSHGGHFLVGDVALRPTIQALADGGRSDVVYDFANRTDDPSYGYQVVHGATTLTEKWDGPTGGLSQNHCMLGHIEEWFYNGLAGIQPTSPGYATLRIHPYLPAGLQWVSAATETVRGRVASSWRVEGDGKATLTVTVPVGAEAEVFVPAGSPDGVTEGALPAASAPGVAFRRSEDGCAVFAVGSGSYHFRFPDADV
jgi:alpha-L-rhamnosidase